MADGTSQTVAQKENDIAALLNWAIPWVYTSAILLFLMSGQIFFHLFRMWRYQDFSATNFLGGICTFSTLLLGYCAQNIFLSAKKYVNTEQEADLGWVMSYLSAYWMMLLITIVVSAVRTISVLLPFSGQMTVTWIVAPALILLFCVVAACMDLRERRFSETFVKRIAYFAKKNLPRTKLVAFMSLAVGIVFLMISVGGFWAHDDYQISIATLSTALGFLLGGISLGLYWWSVREIHRNPSIIFFERTLNQLNFYWMLAPLILLMHLVGSLLYIL